MERWKIYFLPRKKPKNNKLDQSDSAKAANVIFKINMAILLAGADVCSLLDYSFMAYIGKKNGQISFLHNHPRAITPSSLKRSYWVVHLQRTAAATATAAASSHTSCHVSTATRNGQTKTLALEEPLGSRGSFWFLGFHVGFQLSRPQGGPCTLIHRAHVTICVCPLHR